MISVTVPALVCGRQEHRVEKNSFSGLLCILDLNAIRVIILVLGRGQLVATENFGEGCMAGRG